MDPILGQIILWPLNWVPQGWALCDGTILAITQNQALFALIGTTYGGNGTTTFALPDLRNRVPMGAATVAQPGLVQGATSSTVNATGAGQATIGINNLPAHNHGATFTPGGGSASVSIAIPAVGATVAGTNIPGTTTSLAQTTGPASKIYSTGTPDTTLAPFSVSVPAGSGTVAVDNTGSGQALPIQVNVPVTVSTLQPSLSLNYIIATSGIFPSRP